MSSSHRHLCGTNQGSLTEGEGSVPLTSLLRQLFSGSAKANGRETKSCLGRVFDFKLGHFVMYATARLIQKHILA